MSSAVRVIHAALRAAGFTVDIRSTQRLTGGCIHQVLDVELADGTHCVAKVNGAEAIGLFEEEAAGLAALAATRTVLVPDVLTVARDDHHSILLMTHLERSAATERTWQRFGEELAELHAVPVGTRYGFKMSNHLGTTLQPNDWCDDWIEFNARHRLGHQLVLCRANRLLDAREAKQIETVIDRLDQFLPPSPTPSLLHGDLWSGNALSCLIKNELRIAMIDPAVSIGDGWADIAMMQLFGGFPQSCHEAYAAAVSPPESVKERINVYQLYHVLNHITIFGRGYVPQVMSLARTLC